MMVWEQIDLIQVLISLQYIWELVYNWPRNTTFGNFDTGDRCFLNESRSIFRLAAGVSVCRDTQRTDYYEVRQVWWWLWDGLSRYIFALSDFFVIEGGTSGLTARTYRDEILQPIVIPSAFGVGLSVRQFRIMQGYTARTTFMGFSDVRFYTL